MGSPAFSGRRYRQGTGRLPSKPCWLAPVGIRPGLTHLTRRARPDSLSGGRPHPGGVIVPTSPLPDEAIVLLGKANPAVVATVRPDGQPVSVATWYLWDNDRVLLNLDSRRKRLEHLRRDPRVSLTVLDNDSWYTHLSLQGRIAELTDDPDLVDIDRLSRHYTGQPYRDREHPRVSAWMEIESWHGWGQLMHLG